MDREASASIIASLNPMLPKPSSKARYVLAGQQPGLLLGPLYTFLKAVSAIALAKRLSKETNAPVLPLFWIASEDHDVLEVNRMTINGKKFVYPYKGEVRRGRVPQVGDISLEAAKEPLMDFLLKSLPQTEFTPWILDTISSLDFSNYAQTFADLMFSLFHQWELRCVNPMALRSLTAPALADLVEQWPALQKGFDKGSSHIKANGMDPPLQKLSLFEIKEGYRVSLEMDGVKSLPPKEVSNRIRAHSQSFSAGAALRPVLQDAILPVVATVAGPTEMIYLWQIRPLYAAIGVTPSLLQPRISATFVENKVQQALQKAGLESNQLFQAISPDEAIEESNLDVSGIQEKAEDLLREIDRASGASNARWLLKSKGALTAQVEKIILRLKQDKQTGGELNRSRLQKIRDALLPRGAPQERGVNLFQYLNLYGPDFVRLALKRLDPLKLEHQVVFLETKPNAEEE